MCRRDANMLLAGFASLFWATQSYAVKRTIGTGISRQDFFFYSCLCLVPFAAVMLVFTPVYFVPDLWLIPILIVSVVLRYGKQIAEASTVEKLVPYESEAYMCLGVILAYIIDCVAAIKPFTLWGSLSILCAVAGAFLISDVKLQIRKLRMSLVVRIVCDVGLGFMLILRECSCAAVGHGVCIYTAIGAGVLYTDGVYYKERSAYPESERLHCRGAHYWRRVFAGGYAHLKLPRFCKTICDCCCVK